MAQEHPSSALPPVFAAHALAVAWLVSTIAAPLRWVPVFAGSGFVASVAITGVVLVGWALRSPATLGRSAREHRGAIAAAAAVLAAYLVSAIGAGAPPEALLACARAAALCVFATTIVLVSGLPALRHAFGCAAAALLGTYAVLFVAGCAFPGLRSEVFLTQAHQHLAHLPRFAALTGTPGSTGAWALLGVGLVGPLRPRALRRAARVIGAVAALVTLSPATLALPALLAASLVKPGRARIGATCLLAVAGIAPLYFHVLAAEWGRHEVVVSPLHPSYAESGLGAELMPVHEVRLLGARARFHFTAYAALVARAGSCFAEHPALGVGPQEFEEACPVVTMNTYGEWSASRRPHNQFAELGVELGGVGIALFAVAVAVLWRRMAWVPADRWCAGAAVGLIVCSFSGAFLLTVPAAGFLALHLRKR